MASIKRKNTMTGYVDKCKFILGVDFTASFIYT